jgi:hypothetical protein
METRTKGDDMIQHPLVSMWRLTAMRRVDLEGNETAWDVFTGLLTYTPEGNEYAISMSADARTLVWGAYSPEHDALAIIIRQYSGSGFTESVLLDHSGTTNALLKALRDMAKAS